MNFKTFEASKPRISSNKRYAHVHTEREDKLTEIIEDTINFDVISITKQITSIPEDDSEGRFIPGRIVYKLSSKEEFHDNSGYVKNSNIDPIIKLQEKKLKIEMELINSIKSLSYRLKNTDYKISSLYKLSNATKSGYEISFETNKNGLC